MAENCFGTLYRKISPNSCLCRKHVVDGAVIIYAIFSFPGHSDSTPGYIIEDIAKYFNNASQLTEVNLGMY